MNPTDRDTILLGFKNWFKDSLVESHKRNTEKLSDITKFNINPFLLHYLAYYLEGNSLPQSLAKVLVYPRVLGTSITTSFGTLMQTFITSVLNAYGSTTSGIDIEFIDAIDGRRKYCQLKSGPNALNRDDVSTVTQHFTAIRNLARRNNQTDLRVSDTVFCLIYGEPDEKNSFIRELEVHFPVYIGKEFWHRFTGDEGFYFRLIESVAEVATEFNMKDVVDSVITQLSESVEARFSDLYGR